MFFRKEEENLRSKLFQILKSNVRRKCTTHLVEAAAENDETLMEKFFEEGSLNEEELAEGLRIAMANQEIFPVFCVSAERKIWVADALWVLSTILLLRQQIDPMPNWKMVVL